VSALIEDITSSYFAQLISGFPSLLLSLRRIPNPFTLVSSIHELSFYKKKMKSLKSLGESVHEEIPTKAMLSLSMRKIYSYYFLKVRNIKSIEKVKRNRLKFWII